MCQIKRILLLLLFAIVYSCNPGKKTVTLPANNAMSTTVYTPEKLGYELFWEDQFNGTALDPSKWEFRSPGPRRAGYNLPRTVQVKDGYLTIFYDMAQDSVLVGAIGSQGRFETTYGYFECRAKMPKSIGPWAAFWIQSPKISQGEDPALFGTEIDIFEYFKKYGDDITTHAYHWAYGPNQKGVGPLKSELKGLGEGFHTYALEWTPEKYVFYIDGLKFHEVREAISHIDEYMILSIEPPGKRSDITESYTPDPFVVDYVKVYKKKGSNPKRK